MLYDCHAHVFNYEHIPDNFIGIRLTFSEKLRRWARGALSYIWPFSKEDDLEDVADFLRHTELSIEDNAKELLAIYDNNVYPIFLCVDLSAMNSQKNLNYMDQVTKTIELKKLFPCSVFAHFDPSTPYFNELFKMLTCGKIDGVKIYPSMHNYIDSLKMDEVFSYCNENKTPVTAHCSASGVTAESFFSFKRYEANNPIKWKPILEKYPDLKLNFAHFGGEELDWAKTIITYMEKYPNIYTDTSYSIGSDKRMKMYKDLLAAKPILKDRILFGSDYYMVSLSGKDYKVHIQKAQKYLGNIWTEITEINPAKFISS